MRPRPGFAKPKRPTARPCAPGLAACVLLALGSPALADEQVPAAASAPAPAPTSGSPRPRAGGSLGLGPGSYGLARAASARAGIQVASFLATSYQITRAGNSDFWSTHEDTFTSHALLIEFMVPGQMLAIGGGPSFTMGTVEHGCFSILTACDPPRTSERYTGLGVDARLAYTFGRNRPTFRGGFTLELGVHVSPKSGLATFGVGFDVF